MVTDRHIYGEVHNKTDLKKIFTEIRHDVDKASSRPALTELYKRAGYLITLSHAPSWKKKFGDDANTLRAVAEDEFTATARQINHRAQHVGAEPDYDEQWGEATNAISQLSAHRVQVQRRRRAQSGQTHRSKRLCGACNREKLIASWSLPLMENW